MPSVSHTSGKVFIPDRSNNFLISLPSFFVGFRRCFFSQLLIRSAFIVLISKNAIAPAAHTIPIHAIALILTAFSAACDSGEDKSAPAVALAATAVAAVLIVALTGLLVFDRGVPLNGEGTTVPSGPVTESVWLRHSIQMQQIRADLQPTLEQQLALMDPATRQVVEENLAIIEQARENIHNALQISPYQSALGDRYLQLWQQEMGVVRQVTSKSHKM